LELPQLDAQASGAMLVGIANPGQKDGDGEFLGGTWLSLAEARKYLAEPWSALLAQATKQRMEWPAEEIAGWFAMWQPERIGLGQALDVLVTQPASDAEGTLANSAANTTVQSLWRELAGPALVSAGDDGTARATGIESDDDRAYRWYEFTTATEPPVLKIQYSDRATVRPIWMVLAGALGPLLGGALLWLAIGRWLYRPFELLGEAVWPLWLGLAVLGSALLPVLWPGAVLTLCVMIVVWRRFTQSQRDRQFVFAPRSTR
jgi:hypothetical protein